MSSATERVARNLASKKGKNKEMVASRLGKAAPRTTSSGGTSTSPTVGHGSPVQVTSRAAKRSRAEDDVINLTGELEKGKFILPPCVLKQDFFQGVSPQVQPGESLALGGMDRSAKRAMLAQDSSALMRILEMAVVYTEEGSSHERELKTVKDALAAAEEKARKAMEDQEVLKKRITEMAREAETREALLVERNDLINKLKAEAAPAEDETEELKELTTGAELIARIYQADDDAGRVMEDSFNNAVAQLRIANPGFELSTEGTGFLYSVKDGRIDIPEFLRMGETEQPIPEENPV